MKISYRWLKEYIDTDLPPDEVARILTDTGLEVEGIEAFETLPGGLKGVVVGQVKSVSPHPNADRLRLTKVDVGTDRLLDIVCGAPNIAEGQKVWVATVGAELHPSEGEPFQIKKSKIRGEVSEGMVCAEDELGLGTDHEGIAVLPDDAPVGMAAAEYLGAETDAVFEIGLTPNRTDAISHFGVARDLAARLNLDDRTRASRPDVSGFATTNRKSPLTVEVEAVEACPRYSGLHLTDLEVRPSPQWLQDRLRSIGLTPKNNVVDVTNFVMHETGQPLHAFDADRIAADRVVVKTLPEGTPFSALDGVGRKLRADDLMICDERGGMCIAGVLGGADTGVSDQTRNVFLESACFSAASIRRTSKHHGIHTDASFRFERGVDPFDTTYALKRAAMLLTEITGAEICEPMFDVRQKLDLPVQIEFRPERFAALTGAVVPVQRMEKILASLDFTIVDRSESGYTLDVPTYRVDVTREADVVEEVLRIHGYNLVDLPDRMTMSVGETSRPSMSDVVHVVSEQLVGRGFSETMSNGLTRSDFILKVAGEKAKDRLVPMLNPLSMELDVLRPTLAVSALETLSYNLNRQAERLMFFEFGTAYEKRAKSYRETQTLALSLCGRRLPENWNNPEGEFDLSDLRGYTDSIFMALGLAKPQYRPVQTDFLEGARELLIGKKAVGRVGRLSAKARKTYEVKKESWFAEIDFGACVAAVRHAEKHIERPPRYPSVKRDLSLLIDRKVEFGDIEAIGYQKAGPVLKRVSLFDVYEGKNLPQGKKSYAVRFVLRDESKTLTDKRVDKVMGNIRTALEETLGAELR